MSARCDRGSVLMLMPAAVLIVLLLGAIVLPAAFLVPFFSPFGSALVAWTMD